MRTPNGIPDEHWPRDLIDEAIPSIDRDFGECDQDASDLAKSMFDSGLQEHSRSAEAFVRGIGSQILKDFGEDAPENYFVSAVENETEGSEGKKLAKGYIGIRALNEAIETNRNDTIKCPDCKGRIDLEEITEDLTS